MSSNNFEKYSRSRDKDFERDKYRHRDFIDKDKYDNTPKYYRSEREDRNTLDYQVDHNNYKGKDFKNKHDKRENLNSNIYISKKEHQLNNKYEKNKRNSDYKVYDQDHKRHYIREDKYNDRNNSYKKRSKSRSISKSSSRSKSRSGEKYNKKNIVSSNNRKNTNEKRSRSRSINKKNISRSSSSSYKAIKRSPKNKYIKNNNNNTVNRSNDKKNFFNQNSNQLDQSEEIDFSQIYQNNKYLVSSNNQNFQQISESSKNPILSNGKELSNTLIILDLGPDVNLNILEDIFREKCLDLQTSMPEDIRFLESMRSAYIIFPSIPVATKIFESTMGKIYVNGNYYDMQFTPNFSTNNNPYIPSQNRQSLTYVTSLNDSSHITTTMETTVHEDWICEFCDCKNFSKRIVCFKCKRPKTINCRIIPVINQKTSVMGEGGQIPPSTSLLAKSNILKEINETEAFSIYGQVKDIRMICEKITGEPKDFAFIEYYTIEESSMALAQIKRNPVKIRGNPVFVTFSKIRRPEDFKDFTVNSNREFYGYNPQKMNYMNMNMMNPSLKVPPLNFEANPISSMTSQYPKILSVNPSNALDQINISNLDQDEQSKLKNIAQLQNKIIETYMEPELVSVKENKGESNLRREKELTEREKVEIEMKKWKKKIEKQQESNVNKSSLSLKNISINFDDRQNNFENEYESVINLDSKDKKGERHMFSQGIETVRIGMNKIISQPENENQQFIIQNSTLQMSNNLVIPHIPSQDFICEICQRKFPSEEKLKIHENLSGLHKENLKKLNNSNYMI